MQECPKLILGLKCNELGNSYMEKNHHYLAGQTAVVGIACRISLASLLRSHCLYATQASGSSRRREEINGSSCLDFVLFQFSPF